MKSGAGRGADLRFEPVTFGAGFTGRVGRLVARFMALGHTREGIGLGTQNESGEEWLGFRPYRPGDDLRRLDPDLLARLDKPYVSVTRRESSELWAVVVDGSASMGVGEGRSKLQAAAELSIALCALAARRRARVRLSIVDEQGITRTDLAPRDPLGRALAAWSGRRPGGTRGLAEVVRDGSCDRELARAGRLVLLGDLEGIEPADLVGRLRPGRQLMVGALLAGEELNPALTEAITWTSAESGSQVAAPADPRLADRYERRLGARLESFRTALTRHRAAFMVMDSRAPFEEHALDLASHSFNRR